MPAIQRGQAYKLSSGKWGLRYYDAQGVPRRRPHSQARAPRSPTTAMSSSPRCEAKRLAPQS
jgi:hypothetical protein